VSPQGQGLDRRRWLLWFTVGVAVAFTLQVLQVGALDGRWEGLLLVADDGPLRGVIEEQLGDIPVVGGGGHDGQVSYVVALDLDGDEFGDLRPDAGMRWRRILYPFAAGLGGVLEGRALLVGLIVVAALSFGLAVAAVVDIGALLGLPRWVVFAVLANPGVWFAVQLLTPDTLALGLGLVGVAAYLRRSLVGAVGALALAGLAKEQYLLLGLSLAWFAWTEGRRHHAFALAIGGAAPVALWAGWVGLTIGGLSETNESLTAPFGGIVSSVDVFDLMTTRDRALFVLAVSTLLTAMVLPLLSPVRLLRYLAWPWVAAGIVMSNWVWHKSNNALRVLLLAFVFAAVALVSVVMERREPALDADSSIAR
jgi:hypothetical protein